MVPPAGAQKPVKAQYQRQYCEGLGKDRVREQTYEEGKAKNNSCQRFAYPFVAHSSER